jgi:tetratricopeptide (TPR) repeat protein
MTIDQAVQVGLQHHRAGRLADAERFYRGVLAQQPDHAEALHLLGVLAAQAGRHDLAEQLIGRAVAIAPGNAVYQCHLGNVLNDQGKLAAAAAACREAVRLRPDFAEAHYNLSSILLLEGDLAAAEAASRTAIRLNPDFAEAYGNLANAMGRQDRMSEAAAALVKAIELRPGAADAYINLGNVRLTEGKAAEAAAAFRKAIELRPADAATAHFGLGNVHAHERRWDDAMSAYATALRLKPNYADAQYNLGNVLSRAGRIDEAIDAYSSAIRLRPDHAGSHQNMGIVLRRAGRVHDSIAELAEAIRLQPNLVEAHANLGLSLKDDRRLEEAMASCRRAIAIDPNCAAAHLNLSLSLLLAGDYERGWPEYEWRTKVDSAGDETRSATQPQWRAEDIAGKTILLRAEQGHGDAIQFIRYVPLLAKRGATVLVECPPLLKRLMAGVRGVTRVLVPGEPRPAFDVQCPLLSLPLAFDTRLDTAPSDVPYLAADAELQRAWGVRLGASAGRRRVGVAWAGNPNHENDRNRSMPLSALAPLRSVSGIEIHSLQTGAAAAAASDPSAPLVPIDHSAKLSDFAETAALISNLDLVISVDTAVAHLAGAMGKPTWLLLPCAPDWRWLLDRSDSPWYPTVRLFRQSRPGDWAEPIVAVVNELRERVG